MIKKCPVCGKEFITINAVKFCSNTCRRRHQGTAKSPKRRGRESICWSCEKACGGCSWSRSLTPVDGWEAKKIKLKGNFYTGEILKSYIIKSCPEYVKERRRNEHKGIS